MNTKAFVLLLVAVLVVGGSLGGAFVDGMAIGKSQESEAAQSVPTATLTPPGSGRQAADEASPPSLIELRQRLQSGQATPEDLAQLRKQFQGGFAAGGGDVAFGGGARVSGTVTVNTAQGLLRAAVGPETTIHRIAQVTLADLTEGAQITVVGQRAEDGTVEATSIMLTPEGADGFFGGGFRGRGGFGRGRRPGGGQAP